MSEVRIAAEPRTEFGKGAARKIRRDNKVPAVLYGHGTDTQHLTLPGHELLLALRTANVLIRLKGDGVDELALPKGVQRDPIKGFVEHVDLLLVKRGEKVTVDIPVTTVGEVAPTACSTSSSSPSRSRPRPPTSRPASRSTSRAWRSAR